MGFSRSRRRQVSLPFVKSVEIAAKSIRARFFRSLITLLSLVLAISFFTYVKTNITAAKGIILSKDAASVAKLVREGYDLDDPGHNPKQQWIVFLSLLVCVVGIVNTQLMAVTERFREIGTMKCLGALDRFILRLFLIEAFIQGVVGATVGALAGMSVALVALIMSFGVGVFTSISWPDLALTLASSIGLGCFLSVAGVLYPALVAARMAPVEAMRRMG
ncbi:MAG: FtsX-like permease family protein [Desulfobacterium sp.]|jgi:hypothetical protein|nr:FtsX-like permease family protein [Desulfobacterium sp.]